MGIYCGCQCIIVTFPFLSLFLFGPLLFLFPFLFHFHSHTFNSHIPSLQSLLSLSLPLPLFLPPSLSLSLPLSLPLSPSPYSSIVLILPVIMMVLTVHSMRTGQSAYGHSVPSLTVGPAIKMVSVIKSVITPLVFMMGMTACMHCHPAHNSKLCHTDTLCLGSFIILIYFSICLYKCK